MNPDCKNTSVPAAGAVPVAQWSTAPCPHLTLSAKAEPVISLGTLPYPENLARETRAKLERLNQVIVRSSLVEALTQYESGLHEKFSSLEKPSVLASEQAGSLIAGLGQDNVRKAFAGLIERLRTETTLLSELEEIGIAKALPGGIENSKYGANLIFAKEKRSIKDRLLGLGKSKKSAYNATLDLCIVEGTPPGAAEMWETLVTEGILPDVIGRIDKELTKDTQYSRYQQAKMVGATVAIGSAFFVLPGGTIIAPLAAKKIMKHADNDPILSEIHALEAQASSQAFRGLPAGQKERIIQSVVSENQSTKDAECRARKAFQMVHSLRLLGFDDKQIGALVDKAAWGKKEGTWPVMEEALQKERVRLGLISERDFELVMEALEAKYVFETYFQRHKASGIAVAELLKAAKA